MKVEWTLWPNQELRLLHTNLKNVWGSQSVYNSNIFSIDKFTLLIQPNEKVLNTRANYIDGGKQIIKKTNS